MKKLSCRPTEFESISEAFLCGAQFGSIQICRRLLSKLDISLHSKLINPGLILAAKNGHIEMCKYLLSKGAEIESRGILGESALLIAADNGHYKMCHFLLSKAKSDILCCDNRGNSILHIAMKRNHSNICKLVLSNPLSVNLAFSVNANKKTPIELSTNANLIRLCLVSIIEQCTSSHHSVHKLLPPLNEQTKIRITSPFKALPVDDPDRIPTSHLFWRTIGCGKDKCIFSTFNVYPFDRLQDSERIVVLTKVAEAMSGYKLDLECNQLNESTLFVVFAMMKKHIKEECKETIECPMHMHSSSCSSSTPTPPPNNMSDNDGMNDNNSGNTNQCRLVANKKYLWRKRTLNAFENLFKIDSFSVGIKLECETLSVWHTVIDLIAYTVFGESYWRKKQMFECGDTFSRRQYLYGVHSSYWKSTLPSSEQLTSEQIQVMYRKLVTMSKSLLRKNPHQHIKSSENQSLCFCPDCIADRQVPLRFKLQFLEEQAEEKQKKISCKKYRNKNKFGAICKKTQKKSEYMQELIEMKVDNKKKLNEFWINCESKEQKELTTISYNELKDILSASPQWETLRASLNNYTQRKYEFDMLQIKKDKEDKIECIALCEDEGKYEEMSNFLNILFGKILIQKCIKKKKKKNDENGAKPFMIDIAALNEYCINGDFDRIKLLNIAKQDSANDDDDTESIYDDEGNEEEDNADLIRRRDMSLLIDSSLNEKESMNENVNFTQDIWIRYGRKMLEQVVLCEFAKKIAYSYSKKTKISESDAAFKSIIKTLNKSNNLKKDKNTDADIMKKSENKKKNNKKIKKNKKKKEKKKKKVQQMVVDIDDESEVIENIKPKKKDKKKKKKKKKSKEVETQKEKDTSKDTETHKLNHIYNTINKFVTDENVVLSESKSMYASSACSYSNSKPSEEALTISEDSKEREEELYHHDLVTTDDLAIWSGTEENDNYSTISPSTSTLSNAGKYDDDSKIDNAYPIEAIRKRHSFTLPKATKPPIMSRSIYGNKTNVSSYPTTMSISKPMESASFSTHTHVHNTPKRPSRPPQTTYISPINTHNNGYTTNNGYTPTKYTPTKQRVHSKPNSPIKVVKTPQTTIQRSSSSPIRSSRKEMDNKKQMEEYEDEDPFETISNFKEGMMFICSNETFDECMDIKLLGLPKQYLQLIKTLNVSQSALFLFNMSERMLFGVYKATDKGAENINPIAWARNKAHARFSPFPAQIPFRCVYEFKPLPETSFRHMFHDGNRIRKLTQSETKEILTLYKHTLSAKLQNKFKFYADKKNKSRPKTALASLKSKGAPTQNPWTLRAKQQKKKSMITMAIKKEKEKQSKERILQSKDTNHLKKKEAIKQSQQQQRMKPPQLQRKVAVNNKAKMENKIVTKRLPTKPPIISVLGGDTSPNKVNKKVNVNCVNVESPIKYEQIEGKREDESLGLQNVETPQTQQTMMNDFESMKEEIVNISTTTNEQQVYEAVNEQSFGATDLIDSLYANCNDEDMNDDNNESMDSIQNQQMSEMIRSLWTKTPEQRSQRRMDNAQIDLCTPTPTTHTPMNGDNMLSLDDICAHNNNDESNNIVTVMRSNATERSNGLWSNHHHWSPKGEEMNNILPQTPTPPPPAQQQQQMPIKDKNDDDIHDFDDSFHDLTLRDIANGIMNDDEFERPIYPHSNNLNNHSHYHWNDEEQTNEQQPPLTFSSVFKFAPGTDLNPKAKEWNQSHIVCASPSTSATSNTPNPFHINKIINKSSSTSPRNVNNNTPSFEVPSIPSPISCDAAKHSQQKQWYQQRYYDAQQQNQQQNNNFVSPHNRSSRYTQQQHQNYGSQRHAHSHSHHNGNYHQNVNAYNQYQHYTQYQQRYAQQQQQQQNNVSSSSQQNSYYQQQRNSNRINSDYASSWYANSTNKMMNDSKKEINEAMFHRNGHQRNGNDDNDSSSLLLNESKIINKSDKYSSSSSQWR